MTEILFYEGGRKDEVDEESGDGCSCGISAAGRYRC